MDFCSLCLNEGLDFCNQCEQFDLFSPKSAMKKFFRPKQTDDSRKCCRWEPDETSIEQTTTIKIGSSYYCPYCGEYAFVVTDRAAENPYKKNEVVGRCCLCNGARAELEYKKKRVLLLGMHERQLQLLVQQYEEDLRFHTEDLLAIRHFKDKHFLKGIQGSKNSYFEQCAAFSEYFLVVKK